MNSSKTYLFFMLVMLSLSRIGVAQKAYSISGTVYNNQNGKAFQYADIVLFLNNVFIKASSTDVNGRFKLSSLEPGIYKCEVGAVGVSTHCRNIEINGHINVDFEIGGEKIVFL